MTTLSKASAIALGTKIATRSVKRDLEEYKDIKNVQANVSDEKYIERAKSDIKKHVDAHTALIAMLDDESVLESILARSSERSIVDKESLIDTINKRSLETLKLEALFSDYDAVKFLKKQKFNFDHFLRSAMNTREEKLRLVKNLTGKAHSGDLGIYKDLLSAKLKASTSTDKMRFHFDGAKEHTTTRQANALVKVLNYLNGVKTITKGDKVHFVEFDLESPVFEYMNKRINAQ